MTDRADTLALIRLVGSIAGGLLLLVAGLWLQEVGLVVVGAGALGIPGITDIAAHR